MSATSACALLPCNRGGDIGARCTSGVTMVTQQAKPTGAIPALPCPIAA